MSTLLSLLGRVPGAAKFITVLILVLGLLALSYRQFGLTPTLVLAGGILLIYLCFWLFRKIAKRQERQRGLAFGKALDSVHSGPSREEIQVATDELSQKWREAQANLKRANIDIYQLPWYMLIGEPQSGKSTTLKFSGMRFPVGQEAISGGGGTRNCDWWFTEEGVILDTAGRFTFHEQSRTDSTEWDLFLDMLARHRPFCPINGVILVIPTDALLGVDRSQMEKKAQNISKQLLHIQRRLAIQFPVYVMITKCDKVFGFVQFFNKLTPDQQREMFGWSNPDENTGFDTTTFETSFVDLERRIDATRLKLFSEPQFLDNPDQIYTFPEEFDSLKEPLRQYMEIIFKPSVYKDPLFFRGYYFCSGMQQGQPIVSACRNMLPNNQILGKLEDIFNKSRAFFVRDFYSAKVFPEEGLVRRSQGLATMDRWKQRLVWGINIAFLVFGVLFVWGLYRDLDKRLGKPMATIDQTVAVLGSSEATFFSSPTDRELVYRQLSELRKGLTPGEGSSFFGMFQGDQNAMTEPLDDTFAYLYLDRFLLGLFRETRDQVQAFQLKNPPLPRNSTKELESLLAALSEIKRWQVKVFEKQPGAFDPSIRPFLGLVLDPKWDTDLAKIRTDMPLADELEAWFKHVYDRSSPSVKAFLIEEMVRQSKGLYDHLFERVLEFYKNQPELMNYAGKRTLLAQWDLAYQGLAQPSPTWEQHHQKMLDTAMFFSDQNRGMMQGLDTYLPFEKIRTKTIEAMGPEFVVLRNNAPKEGLAAAASQLLENPEVARAKVAEATPFVNQLIVFDFATSGLPDPRGTTEGEIKSTGYSALAENFWTQILDPYLKEFAGEAPYGTTTELGPLLEIGGRRVTALQTYLDANILKHAQLVTDLTLQTQLTRAFSGFYTGRLTAEQQYVSTALTQYLASQPMGIEAPPREWKAYVNRVSQRTSNGQDFAFFTAGPANVAKSLRDNHGPALRAIYLNTSLPYDQIDTYLAQVSQRMGNYYDALMELDAIPSEDVARDRAKYATRIPRQTEITAIAEAPNLPPYLEPYRRDLRAWSEAALSGFRAHGKLADPCPNCAGELSKLREAVKEAGRGFPMSFSGVTQTAVDPAGLTVITATLADPAKNRTGHPSA